MLYLVAIVFNLQIDLCKSSSEVASKMRSTAGSTVLSVC